MNSKLTTEKVIKDLMQSSTAADMDARAQYLFRESLYSLVRLAKAEQMLEIKSNVAKLTKIGSGMAEKLKAEGKVKPTYICVQQQFEFHDPKC